MAFEFLAAGQYKVILGKSFDVKPKKKAPKYFNVSNKVASDRLGYGSEIKLEGKKKKVQVEMKHNQGMSTLYDAELKTEEEFNCILIYNEETKTITLERQSAQINLTRKIIEPQRNGRLNNSPLPGNPYANLQTPPISNNVIQVPAVVEETNVAGGDDFDFDLSKDMDEILDSDDEEDSGSDTFEEIAAPVPVQQQPINSPLTLPVTPTLPSSPNIPLNLALPTTPTTLPSPSSSATAAAKKRKFKMASAPIRHPGIISPLTASTTTPPPITHQNNTFSGKRPKVNHDDQSSSGSEEDDSSSGSESGSTETGSSSGESESESGSDSDDDFESLAQDISMSLSKGGPSAPASPQQQQQYHQPSPSNYKPYDSTPGNTPTPSNSRQPPPSQQNGGAGPMSLRALFKEDDEEESLSSSSSDDNDDD
ncbi:unnamed protein product [Mucor hiemalis]